MPCAGGYLHGLEGWNELFCGAVLEAEDPDLADVPGILHHHGYMHPWQVATADLTAIFNDSSIASVVQNRCALYSGGATACHSC